MKAVLGPRAQAALIISELLAGHGSLSTHLDALPAAEQSLIQEISFGCCRHFGELDFLRRQLLDKPLRNKDSDIASLLLVGLYQLRFLRIPDHAAVNESVAAARDLGKPWAAALVNAVLRNYLKRQASLEEELSRATAELRFSHPAWLVDQIKADWPDTWEAVLAANNQRPPMTLRVNLAKGSREAALEALAGDQIDARPGLLAKSAIYLENPCSVEKLPGFSTGTLSVQDEASQLVPGLMDLQPGLRVLDACAAPGGKTCHILESEQSLTALLALDISAARLKGIQENLQRLGLRAELKTGDASRRTDWWDGAPFDRILLDAPCSATGVIRRHPDIKLLRRAADIKRLAELQLQILDSLWPCLAVGGQLLYTSCSILRAENDSVIEAFLQNCPDAKYAAITADWGVECRFGRQLLPDHHGSDGFYFSRLLKNQIAPGSTALRL